MTLPNSNYNPMQFLFTLTHILQRRKQKYQKANLVFQGKLASRRIEPDLDFNLQSLP